MQVKIKNSYWFSQSLLSGLLLHSYPEAAEDEREESVWEWRGKERDHPAKPLSPPIHTHPAEPGVKSSLGTT